jgi:RNA polymerase sigma-70 factor (ECF subfamily)
VQRAAAGDQAALTELVQRHRNLVFAVSLATVGDPDMAEDIAQEAFLTAFRSLPTLKDPTALPAWLRRITRRQCARVLRRKRVPTHPLDSAAERAAEWTDPTDLLDETRDTVLRALWRILAAQREILALHYLEGLSQRGIAALLGLPVTTVNNRMHEGRLTLRRELLRATTRFPRGSRLPVRFTDRLGAILRIRGPVVDVRFEIADLPDVLETLTVRDDVHKRDAILEVVQRRGRGVVRVWPRPPSRSPGAR